MTLGRIELSLKTFEGTEIQIQVVGYVVPRKIPSEIPSCWLCNTKENTKENTE